MTPGVFEGKRYDGIMRNLEFNHLALVVSGRVGADCVVGDSKENVTMKTNSNNKVWILTAKSAGAKMAMDDLGEAADPVEVICKWARQNLSAEDIDRLCLELTRESVSKRPDPDGEDENVERGQRVVEGKQAQDTARFDRRFGREPEVREGATYDKLFGRSTKQAQDSARRGMAYDELFGTGPKVMHNWAAPAQEFVPRASGFGDDDDGSFDALFGDGTK
jgi:hypothetical protein